MHNLKSIYAICIKQGFIESNITYERFATLVREFHKSISEAIQLGYKFEPTGELGTFQIVKDIRRGKTINWGESNKMKQRIIDAGGTPFNKETAPEGEKWFIYYTDNDYFKWRWWKRTPCFVKNMTYYTFMASTKNRRTIKQVLDNNALVEHAYGVYR